MHVTVADIKKNMLIVWMCSNFHGVWIWYLNSVVAGCCCCFELLMFVVF
jgi:hypothetical protein